MLFFRFYNLQQGHQCRHIWTVCHSLRRGMNNPLPLRPVAAFTSDVHADHVPSSNGKAGSISIAVATIRGRPLQSEDRRLTDEGPPRSNIFACSDVFAHNCPKGVCQIRRYACGVQVRLDIRQGQIM